MEAAAAQATAPKTIASYQTCSLNSAPTITAAAMIGPARAHSRQSVWRTLSIFSGVAARIAQSDP